ncbi:MAG: hypothetical protein WA840_18255 [Caulobacteraceae bacterium]
MIATLPQMPLHRMAGSWLNAVRRLSDDALSSTDHEEAERLIAAMHLEWARRSDTPLPGDPIDDWPVNNEFTRQKAQGPQKHTPLTAHGYHVGRRFGLPTPVRREVLRRCAEEPLMPAFSARVMQVWGEPRSDHRLQQIADHIADSVNNNRNLVRNSDAVADWRNDFSFLKTKYAKAHIRWPPLRRSAIVVE